MVPFEPTEKWLAEVSSRVVELPLARKRRFMQEYQLPAGDAQTFVYHAESDDYFEGIYIVTSNKQVTIPEFPNGWELRRDMSYYWTVETHGDYASVDQMTGGIGDDT